MGQVPRRPTPATIVGLVALFVALGGSAYAAGRIDGRTVRVGSLPGNRLKRGSVPANRLKPGALRGYVPAAPLTGEQIDERSLGQVPSAAYAEAAGSALTAVDAQTAVNAVNAVDAGTVNGHGAGCLAGTRLFAGACWQTSASEAAATAPVAAVACAAQGGTLPEALQLAAFAQEPGVKLSSGDEWSSDVPVITGPDAYAVVVVQENGVVTYAPATNTRHYRCVIPLLV
jgi:hypothetical protein